MNFQLLKMVDYMDSIFDYAQVSLWFCNDIEYTAKKLWPEQFKDVDPKADLKEFFSKYMPIEYSGVFFEDWKDRMANTYCCKSNYKTHSYISCRSVFSYI